NTTINHVEHHHHYHKSDNNDHEKENNDVALPTTILQTPPIFIIPHKNTDDIVINKSENKIEKNKKTIKIKKIDNKKPIIVKKNTIKKLIEPIVSVKQNDKIDSSVIDTKVETNVISKQKKIQEKNKKIALINTPPTWR
ncbi:MAG: hypothetical protein LBD05_01260, partial [Mycoplasmataceae bacterium]|nr:hypothetical protein [Mycoplasmataceae bacterium]